MLREQIAAMGRLALIADDLGNTAAAAAMRSQMIEQLKPWLAGTNADPLKYDTVYGGITAENGLTNGALQSACAPILYIIYNVHCQVTKAYSVDGNSAISMESWLCWSRSK